MQPVDQTRKILQYTSSGGWKTSDARIIDEAPVELNVNGEPWLTFMCTPSHLEALGVGFLYNEGIIIHANEISTVRACDNGCQLDVWLNHTVTKPLHWRRTSGCTGGATATQESNLSHAIMEKDFLPPDLILAGMDDLLRQQELYRSTRGVHCSMLTDGEGTSLLAEDIGRHNTLDKLAGRLLLENPRLKRRLVFTTGRISSEMLQKSARMGASAVISRTSPTALSVRLADELGITVVGYARRTQFNVYTHAWRFQSEAISLDVNAEPACEFC